MRRPALLLPLALAACTGSGNTERDFLCSAQTGEPCTSISAVDGSGPADVSALAGVTERPEDARADMLTGRTLTAGKAGSAGGHGGMPDGGHPYNAAAYRTPEVVGTLWIAPYLDGDAILHESRYVHFVIQEGRWRQEGPR
jgi:conjugal transfer pilus assembly protein TraV